ncbi:MAG: DinB family protein [Armatimonadota bacterium]
MTKAETIESVRGSFTILEKDLIAMPEDLFTKSFQGKSRSVADIIFEINAVNDHIGATIRGETPAPWPYEGFVTAPPDFQAKEVVIASLLASRDRFMATIDALSEEDLLGTVQTERGPTTSSARCRFVANHNWYHSGQLNFIQTLSGDDGWNW